MRRRKLFLSACLIIGLQASPTSGQDVVGTGTLGAVLDHLMDQIQQTIDDARNAGNSLEANAGREAAITIANVQSALHDSLNDSIATVDPVIHRDLDQIQSTLGTTEFKTNSDLENLTSQLQSLVHSLPFRQHQPQLLGTLPASIAPGRATPKVRITFKGSFEDSSRPGFAASLAFGKLSFQPIENDDKHLVFEVPITVLMGDSTHTTSANLATSNLKSAIDSIVANASAIEASLQSAVSAQGEEIAYLQPQAGCPFRPSEYTPEAQRLRAEQAEVLDSSVHGGSSTRMTLSVPWRETKAAGLWHTKEVSLFNVVIDRLPPTPGKLTLVSRSDSKVPVVKEFVSRGYHQASTREAGNEDHKDVPYLVTPDTGWHIVRNTSRFVVASQQGVWSLSFAGDDGDHVIYNVTTIHKSIGSSGSVDFGIHFLETKDVDCTQTTSTPYLLAWGDSRAIDPKITSWQLDFDAFDGTHQEFAGTDLTNPYVKIVNESGTFVIKATDPNMVSWPPKP